MYFVMSTWVKKETLWVFVQMSKIISMLLILLLHITLIFIIIIVCDIVANHMTQQKQQTLMVRMYLNYTYIYNGSKCTCLRKPLRSAVLICLFAKKKKIKNKKEIWEMCIQQEKENWKFPFWNFPSHNFGWR